MKKYLLLLIIISILCFCEAQTGDKIDRSETYIRIIQQYDNDSIEKIHFFGAEFSDIEYEETTEYKKTTLSEDSKCYLVIDGEEYNLMSLDQVEIIENGGYYTFQMTNEAFYIIADTKYLPGYAPSSWY